MILLAACWKSYNFPHVSWCFFSCSATEHDNHDANGHACVANGHSCVATDHTCVVASHACVATGHACVATGPACVATGHDCVATGCLKCAIAFALHGYSSGQDVATVRIVTVYNVHASQIILTCSADFS